MRTHTPLLLCLGLALILSACRNTSQGGGGELENVHWRLMEIHGKPAILDSSAREAHITFSPADSSAAGNSGCNQFGGKYVRNGEKLRIERIISTKMACIGTGVMEQESTFFAALETTATWKRGGESLELQDANGRTIARFKAITK